MTIDIITPLTRPENIWALRDSIENSRNKGVQIFWHIYCDPLFIQQKMIFDFTGIGVTVNFPFNSGIAGHAHRNTFLMQRDLDCRMKSPGLADCWIMSLDDDNILHPGLIPWMIEHGVELYDYSCLLVDQVFKNGSYRLRANPDEITVGKVDTAQLIFRGSILQGLRFDEARYDADGVFIEELYKRHKDKFLFVNQPLCYYNYLR